MGLKDMILGIPQVEEVMVKKDAFLHGQEATEVEALLEDGRSVIGTFTDGDNTEFGGIDFEQRKNIGALMVSKIKSVLEGTAE